jgi:hypothetical protein
MLTIFITDPFIFKSIFEMSSALTSLVPVLSGDNFTEWTDNIEPFLMSQGLWYVITQTKPAPGEDGELDWANDNLKAMGNMRLRMTPAVKSKVKDLPTALKIWDKLKEQYGKPGVSAVFTEFKRAMRATVPPNAHPASAIDEIIMYFDRIAAHDIDIPDFIKSMIIISKLPPRYEYVVENVAQIEISKHATIKPEQIRTSVVHAWEGKDQGNDKGKGSANKISAVKRKRDEPNFRQQRRDGSSSSSQQHNHNDSGSAKGEKQFKARGKRGGRKKWQKANEASTSARLQFAAPTIATTPSAKDVRVPFFKEAPPVQDGIFPQVKKAIDLARSMGLQPTAE